jgi:hypothetical protein
MVSHAGRAAEFSMDELALLSDALDSHIYWQLSDPEYRDSGYVNGLGSADPEKREMMKDAKKLDDKIAAIRRERERMVPRRCSDGT